MKKKSRLFYVFVFFYRVFLLVVYEDRTVLHHLYILLPWKLLADEEVSISHLAPTEPHVASRACSHLWLGLALGKQAHS